MRGKCYKRGVPQVELFPGQETGTLLKVLDPAALTLSVDPRLTESFIQTFERKEKTQREKKNIVCVITYYSHIMSAFQVLHFLTRLYFAHHFILFYFLTRLGR